MSRLSTLTMTGVTLLYLGGAFPVAADSLKEQLVAAGVLSRIARSFKTEKRIAVRSVPT
jgi:hypothetical protein